MAVTVNATGTKQYRASATSLSSTPINVAAGSNTALFAQVAWSNGTSANDPTGVSVTWNGAAMNLVGGLVRQGIARCALYVLAVPATGIQTLAMSWTNSHEIFLGAMAFDGVDPVTPAQNFNSSTGAATVVVTSAAGNKVIAQLASGLAAIPALTGTSEYTDNVNGAFINAGANYDAGAATVAIGQGSGTCQNIVACDIKAAAAASGKLFRQGSLDGIGGGGPFFSNPLARVAESFLGWRRRSGLFVTARRKLILPSRHERLTA